MNFSGHLRLKCTSCTFRDYCSDTILFSRSDPSRSIVEEAKRISWHNSPRNSRCCARSSILVQDHGFQVPAILRYWRGDRRACTPIGPSFPLAASSLLFSLLPRAASYVSLECPFSPQSSGLSETLQIRVAPRSFRVGVPPTADHDSVEIKHDPSAIKASHVEMHPEKSASFGRPIF